MHKRTIIGVAAVAFICFGLVGCTAGSDAPSPVGSWGSHADGQPNLEFTVDKTLQGNDGCNSISGSWEQDGATVALSDLGITEMFCEGVDDWLNGLASATMSGTTMTIANAEGATIGTLQRDGE